jgi:DNA polymerase-3 subunit epsilon
MAMREIVLDTETTGLNYRSGDRVTEVGCTELINHVATENNLQFYCSVNKRVSEDAIRISGLTNDFLSKHPPFKDSVDSFLDFIKDDTLVIHNADFDVGFINNELNIAGKSPLKNKIIDTVSLARKTLNTRVANLDYLCRRFSIDLSERGLHGALLDTQLLAEVYLELIGGKQISMNLDLSANKKDISEKNIGKSKLVFSNIQINNKEILLHKNLVKQIKSPLWGKIDY